MRFVSLARTWLNKFPGFSIFDKERKYPFLNGKTYVLQKSGWYDSSDYTNTLMVEY